MCIILKMFTLVVLDKYKYNNIIISKFVSLYLLHLFYTYRVCAVVKTLGFQHTHKHTLSSWYL